jgi:Fur family ferric uptake transcriptional regulator
VTKDELRTAIRGAGLRATAQRVAVLGLLSKSAEPLSHGEISERLANLATERSTIYRNIIALARAGLVERTGRDTAWRFAFTRGVAHARAHPHFVCNSCGRTQCLEKMTVAMGRVDGPRAVKLREFEIQLRGACDDCDQTT